MVIKSIIRYIRLTVDTNQFSIFCMFKAECTREKFYVAEKKINLLYLPGTPNSLSIKRTQFCAFTGSSSNVLAFDMSVPHPGSVSYRTSTLFKTSWLAENQTETRYIHKVYVFSTTKHSYKLFVFFLYEETFSEDNTSTRGANLYLFLNISGENKPKQL